MDADDFHRATVSVRATSRAGVTTDLDRRKEGGVRTLRELEAGTPDAVTETKVTIEMDVGAIRCEWGSPLKRVQFPLERGSVWQATSECSAQWFGGSEDRRRVSERVRVGDEREAVVEGRHLAGYVLNRDFTFESSAQGLKDTGTLTELYSPELGVALQHRRIVRREHLGTVSYHREESRLIGIAASPPASGR